METDSTPRLPPLVAAAMVSIIMFSTAGVAALISVLPQERGSAAAAPAAPLAYTDPDDPPPLTPIREPAPQEPLPQEQVIAVRAPVAAPATLAHPVAAAGRQTLAVAPPPAATSATPAVPPAAGASTSPPAAAAACADCGTVVAVTPVNTAKKPSGFGAVGGAMLGGVVGHQMGKGRGRDAMTAAGAIGGAVAGNEIEKRRKQDQRYDVTVRLPDGSQRHFSFAQAPAFSPGDRVRIDKGRLLPAD